MSHIESVTVGADSPYYTPNAVQSASSVSPAWPLVAGNWYPIDGPEGALTTRAISAGECYYMPKYWPGGSIDGLGINIGTGSASSALRCGVWTNVDGVPATLLVESASLDTSTSGDKESTFTAVEIDEGWVWLGVGNVGLNGPSARAFTAAPWFPFGRTTLAAVGDDLITCLAQVGIGAALPATANATIFNTGAPFRICYRVAA